MKSVRRVQRRHAPHAAAAALIAVVVVVLAIGALSRFGIADRSAPSLQGVALRDLPPEGLSVLDKLPFPVVPDVVEWTGQSLLVFGAPPSATPDINAGAEYAPDSGLWRKIAPFPADDPVRGIKGIWFNDRLVVLGKLCNLAEPADPDDVEDRHCFPGTLVAAAYFPDGDHWETLPAPPNASQFKAGDDASFGQMVGTTHDEVIVEVLGTFLAVNPQSGTWRELPYPPIAGQGGALCAIGSSIIAWTPIDAESVNPDLPRESPSQIVQQAGIQVGVLGKGSGEWSVSKYDLRVEFPNHFEAVCTDSGLFVYTFKLDSFLYFDVASNKWVAVPAPSHDLAQRPLPEGVPSDAPRAPVASSHAAFTGREVLFWTPDWSGRLPAMADRPPAEVRWAGVAFAFVLSTGEWRAAKPGPSIDLTAWTNDGFSFLPAIGPDGDLLATYRP